MAAMRVLPGGRFLVLFITGIRIAVLGWFLRGDRRGLLAAPVVIVPSPMVPVPVPPVIPALGLRSLPALRNTRSCLLRRARRRALGRLFSGRRQLLVLFCHICQTDQSGRIHKKHSVHGWSG